MENASKALLIAASVLIAIVLIAFGVSVLNSTKGTGDNVKQTMSATEIATFNNKFSADLGDNKSAARAKALANIVVSNNATNKTKIVEIIIASPSGLKGTYKEAIDITNKVAQLEGSGSILVTGYSKEGLITQITLTY